MILITTPSGDIGSRVLRNVLKHRQDVRVIARNTASLPEKLRSQVEVVEGSHADVEVIERAMAGVKSVLWLPPGSPDSPSAEAAYVDFSRTFCDALPASGVTHVVGISALGRGWPKPAGLVTASLQMDDMIGSTGVNYRALTCASLMDNIQRQAGLIQSDGVFYQPTPARLKMPHVAKADVAAVAAGHLLSSDWLGVKEVPLMGPEDISFEEMAEVMSSVLGRPVRYQELPMDQFAGMLAATGASDGMVRAYVDMLTAKNEGMDTVARPAARTETPTTFRRWCEIELRPLVAM